MISRDTYIEQRLDKQINWYNKKSSTAKMMYISLNSAILILTSFIPVLTVLNDINELLVKIVVCSFGAISAILTGAINIINCKENWIRYRQLTESLEKEKMLYCTQSRGYGELDNLDKLIEKCEELMRLENNMWVSTNNSNKK